MHDGLRLGLCGRSLQETQMMATYASGEPSCPGRTASDDASLEETVRPGLSFLLVWPQPALQEPPIRKERESDQLQLASSRRIALEGKANLVGTHLEDECKRANKCFSFP